jgi:hypothetical protein
LLLTNERAPRAYHQPSHSASAVETHSPLRDDLTVSEITSPPQSDLLSTHSPSRTPNRSRTPDPASDDLAPVDHVVLSRCSTAPAAESFSDILAANGKHDPATRHMTSANKLTRMGFSAKEGWQPSATISVSPRGDQKSRFGIKSFFKGKS